MNCIVCKESAEDTFNDIPYCIRCWTAIEHGKVKLYGSPKELRKQLKDLGVLK
jgi:hypothetical protein